MAMTAIFLEEGKQTSADVAGRLAEFLAAAHPACISPSTIAG